MNCKKCGKELKNMIEELANKCEDCYNKEPKTNTLNDAIKFLKTNEVLI